MTITSTLVNGGLTAARLPLTVAERALRRGDQADEWPPARAFDAFGATVKQVVGSLTHDDALADSGRLTQARVGQSRRGEEFETLAAALEAEADAQLEARHEADAERRRQVDARTQARKRRAEELAHEESERAAAAHAKEAAAEADARASAARAATRRERAARADRLQAERSAIVQEERVAAAEQQVDRIDAELAAVKATRRSQ